MYTLAAELRRIGLAEMAERAQDGYYVNHLSPIDNPKHQLREELTAIGTSEALALVERHLDGEFESAQNEDTEWWDSPEGRCARARRHDKQKQITTNHAIIDTANHECTVAGTRSLWTVHDGGTLYPGLVLARNSKAGEDYTVVGDVDTIRASLMLTGLLLVASCASADSDIIEIWATNDVIPAIPESYMIRPVIGR